LLQLLQYSNKGATSCIDCSVGYYAPVEGQVACTVSPAGYIANATGMAKVNICPSGKYAGAGSDACTNCHLGYFSSAGSAICADACQAGAKARLRVVTRVIHFMFACDWVVMPCVERHPGDKHDQRRKFPLNCALVEKGCAARWV
jgi:hypothetical protein